MPLADRRRAGHAGGRPRVERLRDIRAVGQAPAHARPVHEDADIIRVPVLADGADPGKKIPSPMAIRDRLVIDRRLVEDHDPDRLFAYDITPANMGFLHGIASVGDRVVFRRGGRITPDRICAVRTERGIVLARVLFRERSLLLLPGQGQPESEAVEIPDATGRRGVVAGTHVLLIRP